MLKVEEKWGGRERYWKNSICWNLQRWGNSMPRGAILLHDRARAAHAPDRCEWAFPRLGERRWVDKRWHVALTGWLNLSHLNYLNSIISLQMIFLKFFFTKIHDFFLFHLIWTKKKKLFTILILLSFKWSTYGQLLSFLLII